MASKKPAPKQSPSKGKGGKPVPPNQAPSKGGKKVPPKKGK